MQHRYFEIQNFKGIAHIRLDFNPRQQRSIYAFVGLNESGKTTVLEGFNFTRYKSETLDPLNLPGYSIRDVHDLIPISKRSNFNENIIIKVGYSLEADDIKQISDFLLKSYKFNITNGIHDFTITQSYKFRNSQLAEPHPQLTWDLVFRGKYHKSRKVQTLEKEHWSEMVKHIRPLLPSVLYFPNFLFEFPDKIYLEEAPSDAQKHEFYKQLLQDVNDAIGENTNLNDHIIQRAKDAGTYSKQALESVLLKMGSHITTTIFQAWDRIFNRPRGNREIIVNADKDESGRLYLQLRLKESNEIYAISERSVGFRWFFAFLLLTQYRGFRKDAPKNILFLLDEPASNLHPSAQMQLLESFEKFSEGCSIIYTTHSHYMINPDWLENTYVVKNEGLDYDKDDDSYNAKKTVITLHKYRTFAAQHPEQSTYFQPVLDVLNYRPSKLENIPDIVMAEGKNDFYILKYLDEKMLHPSSALNLLPGGGSGSLDNVIRLYLAWGRDFIVLLDSDQAGTEQKKRYEDLFGVLVEGRIFSLSDINTSWNGKSLEFMFEENDRNFIQQSIYPETQKYKKKLFNRAIQELYAGNQVMNLSEATRENFKIIFEFCRSKFSG